MLSAKIGDPSSKRGKVKIVLFYLLQQNISVKLYIILSALFWVNLLFARQSLWHDQATFAPPMALTSYVLNSKKWRVENFVSYYKLIYFNIFILRIKPFLHFTQYGFTIFFYIPLILIFVFSIASAVAICVLRRKRKRGR